MLQKEIRRKKKRKNNSKGQRLFGAYYVNNNNKKTYFWCPPFSKRVNKIKNLRTTACVQFSEKYVNYLSIQRPFTTWVQSLEEKCIKIERASSNSVSMYSLTVGVTVETLCLLRGFKSVRLGSGLEPGLQCGYFTLQSGYPVWMGTESCFHPGDGGIVRGHGICDRFGPTLTCETKHCCTDIFTVTRMVWLCIIAVK